MIGKNFIFPKVLDLRKKGKDGLLNEKRPWELLCLKKKYPFTQKFITSLSYN